MGLGPSLPPAELARRDSVLSGKWNAYFLLRRMQILVVGTWSKGEEVRSENELVAKTLASVN